ncbi:hypothetical protein EXIGLDRAFT_835054 [Exidia glandulosa HHB12029]|uniref:RRM domain-containing protein n=1 Tax=Exidia glandulosa HHB12029 TaxID=1314781 RepID=A0A165J5J2_EXIGL|nr:hypothetical protein EXIGLDRAFT_835054 [Exidia glandulosa HHB12029]
MPSSPTSHTLLDFVSSNSARAYNSYMHDDASINLFPESGPSTMSSSSHAFARKTDARRNLYVLGLPVDLTQEEFAHLFSAYGDVEHSVIMATLDQFNRRRGFIVMNTNDQAHAAMRALSGRQLKGHQLHVSFAVVQRSEGFLDGGDRIPRRRRQTHQTDPSSSPLSPDVALFSSPPLHPADHAHTLNTTIVALNLCPVALPRATDVHELFARCGSVRAVRLARGNPGTAVVAFNNAEDAAAALELLDGMPLGSFVVRLMSTRL